MHFSLLGQSTTWNFLRSKNNFIHDPVSVCNQSDYQLDSIYLLQIYCPHQSQKYRSVTASCMWKGLMKSEDLRLAVSEQLDESCVTKSKLWDTNKKLVFKY